MELSKRAREGEGSGADGYPDPFFLLRRVSRHESSGGRPLTAVPATVPSVDGASYEAQSRNSGLSQRLADFEASFQQKTKMKATEWAGSRKTSSWRSVYESLRDLFTEGVTREGISGLFKGEARDTLHFFTRELILHRCVPSLGLSAIPRRCGRSSSPWRIA